MYYIPISLFVNFLHSYKCTNHQVQIPYILNNDYCLVINFTKSVAPLRKLNDPDYTVN